MTVILSDENDVSISAATFWELAIKNRLGRIDIDLEELRTAVTADGFGELPVEIAHMLRLRELPTTMGTLSTRCSSRSRSPKAGGWSHTTRPSSVTPGSPDSTRFQRDRGLRCSNTSCSAAMRSLPSGAWARRTDVRR